jgi:hypothetical protein
MRLADKDTGIASKETPRLRRFQADRAMSITFGLGLPQYSLRRPVARRRKMIPAGVLDADPGARPENSIFWKSKAAWYVSPDEMKKFAEMG